MQDDQWGTEVVLVRPLEGAPPTRWRVHFWLFVLTALEGSQYAPATLWAGVATGAGVAAVGVAIGGRIFERGGERLMEFVETA